MTFILALPGLICFAGGCAQTAAPITAHAPTLEELPPPDARERVLPVRVGVDGRGNEPQVSLAPTFEAPELTPEEKEAVGETDPPFDVLAFYRPARGPEHGVFPFDALQPGAVALWDTGRAGTEPIVTRVGVDLAASPTTYIAVYERTTAGLELRSVGPRSSMYVETGFSTGSSPPRSTAQAATKVDY